MRKARVLLDSNILLRWLEPEQPDQIIVKRALERLLVADADLCYTSQNLGEFWNALTRRTNRNGYGLSPAQAHLRARAVESKITLLPDTPDVHTEWRKLLVTHWFPEPRSTTPVSSPQCTSMASSASLPLTRETSRASRTLKPSTLPISPNPANVSPRHAIGQLSPKDLPSVPF